MNISISINGVLRNLLSRIKYVYEKYTSKEIGEITDLDLSKFLDFNSEEELLEFIYVECPMEIFGHGGDNNKNIFNIFNRYYQENKLLNNIRLVSDEIEKARPATMFFLAKNGVVSDELRFYNINQIKGLWEDTDLFITSDPEILKNKPNRGKTIKIETEYNKDIDSDYVINSFDEVFELEYDEERN